MTNPLSTLSPAMRSYLELPPAQEPLMLSCHLCGDIEVAKHSCLRNVLIRRDDCPPEVADELVADELIADARKRVAEGEDPEEVLADEFGLEPDYVFDLLP